MTKYYGVIGNRDYIKINGEKRPFWEFLDQQPDGYLTSLVYMRKDLPDMPMIFDCGAWSYKGQEVPKITAQIALDNYLLLAKPNDILIAPDHMLIDGVDLNFRRVWNRDQAKMFIKICPDKFKPMATLHGMDINERLQHGRELASMGYQHIAIGGVAARASQKSTVLEIVQKIRNEIPNTWLHILGLSSPSYFKTWTNMGIESCDGSSHFKQAFTGGTFFTIENAKLKKWQAARPTKKESIVAPQCSCTACERLKEQGIDVRSYGSNEHNMGRAAHNMNMLMRAQRIAANGTTVLVSCVSKKSDIPQQSKNLYKSDWFIKARKWAEKNGDRWYILSAKYGLLDPEKIIEPYNMTLSTMSSDARREWGVVVTEQIKNRIKFPSKIILLAGQKYREHIDLHNYIADIPMKGLGIGQQLQWLNNQNLTQG